MMKRSSKRTTRRGCAHFCWPPESVFIARPKRRINLRVRRSRSEEMLDRWNDIRNKLVVMAQDFPEDMSVRTSRYHP